MPRCTCLHDFSVEELVVPGSAGEGEDHPLWVSLTPRAHTTCPKLGGANQLLTDGAMSGGKVALKSRASGAGGSGPEGSSRRCA